MRRPGAEPSVGILHCLLPFFSKTPGTLASVCFLTCIWRTSTACQAGLSSGRFFAWYSWAIQVYVSRVSWPRSRLRCARRALFFAKLRQPCYQYLLHPLGRCVLRPLYRLAAGPLSSIKAALHRYIIAYGSKNLELIVCNIILLCATSGNVCHYTHRLRGR